MKLFEELNQRGLVDQTTSQELANKAQQKSLHFYVGLDPSASSFHIGQLAVFNLLRIFQAHGHQPIALLGGATGVIGDPSGKDEERNWIDPAVVQQNSVALQQQLDHFLHFEQGKKTIWVNNYDWLSKFSYLDFLRQVGKHFSVNQMLMRDSVSNRIQRQGSGITYTEFSYMLLQAYDFYHLAKHYHCELQVGGSDQWGNIVSGVDLTRRLLKKECYGLTMPLLTKADGEKFGKSASGAVWLSAELTSPYQFYQYLVRQADAEVDYLLKRLTYIPLAEIQQLQQTTQQQPEKREAQKTLARWLTQTVHGKGLCQRVEKASQILFGQPLDDLDDAVLSTLFGEIPSASHPKTKLEQSYLLVDALVDCQACPSKGQARRLIEAGGVRLNDQAITTKDYALSAADLSSPHYLLGRVGKKNYWLLRFESE